MRKFIALFTLLGMVFSSGIYANENENENEVYYTEDDDDLFNHGKFVGQESDEYLRRIRRERNKNWAIALASTAIGVTTVVLVGKNHKQ